MNVGSLIGLLIAAGFAYSVYHDAVDRGWEPIPAILMATEVLVLLIIFLPLYLLVRDNPGRKRVSLAASRALIRQYERGAEDLVLDSIEIARELGISKAEIVRKFLQQSVSQGEISAGVRIL